MILISFCEYIQILSTLYSLICSVPYAFPALYPHKAPPLRRRNSLESISPNPAPFSLSVPGVEKHPLSEKTSAIFRPEYLLHCPQPLE